MDTKQTTGLTPEQQSAEWNRTAFVGNEPFNDGVTPEVLAKQAQRAAEAKERAAKAEAARNKRIEFRSRAPLQEISYKLKKVTFAAPLTAEEQERTRNILCDCGPVGKAERRDVNFTLFKYFRAGFSASGGMNILVMKLATPEEASDVFRIADMARVLFWKHRKPGYLGVECGNEYLNYSLKRAENDIIDNPDVVALLEEYRKFLLDTGVFSEHPEWSKNASAMRRTLTHYRTATVMTNLDALAQRLNDVATAQEVHKQNLITLNTELSKANNEALARHAHTLNALNALQEKLVNVLNIALRLMNRVEVLEGVRLNTPMYVPPQPGEPCLVPGPSPHYVPCTGPTC